MDDLTFEKIKKAKEKMEEMDMDSGCGFGTSTKVVGMNRHQRRGEAKMANGIVEDGMARAERCRKRVNKVLEEEDCIMIPKMILVNKDVTGVIEIAPKPNKPRIFKGIQ